MSATGYCRFILHLRSRARLVFASGMRFAGETVVSFLNQLQSRLDLSI
jgi:hypothetical protein